MFKVLRLLILSLACVITGAEAGEVQEVSMVQLIANPQHFNGKRVRVTAYLNLEFEGNALYLHRDDYDYSLLMNAVAISLTDQQARKSATLSGGYVAVEGTFRIMERRDFMSMFSGSLESVTRLQRLNIKRRCARGVAPCNKR